MMIEPARGSARPQNVTLLMLWHYPGALGVKAADLLDEEQAALVERPELE